MTPLEAAWLAGILRNPGQAYVRQFLAATPDTGRAAWVLRQMRTLPRHERWRRLQSPKGLPFREWCLYNRRNAGWIWPWRCLSPWLRILLGR